MGQADRCHATEERAGREVLASLQPVCASQRQRVARDGLLFLLAALHQLATLPCACPHAALTRLLPPLLRGAVLRLQAGQLEPPQLHC